jgi:hypothetical protein
MKLSPEAAFFEPCNNITIIKRMINGLVETYKMSGNQEKADDLLYLLGAMEL